ncbi:protein kinase, putative [Bodo saltans]|uniref:Aurora kinase n=1 Tax=Bodo saltans TaxID=75058 RepID=A0A0S4JBR3_BODSA|nr:protein kinase, putative [Bodo saltans]|eukprot:CUG87411.1 protein kinase, putative [Bodo saltans]
MSVLSPTSAIMHGGEVINSYLVKPPAPRASWNINDFELLHKLGGGNYGDVYLASVKNSNFIVAIKKLEIEKLVNFDVVNQLRREVEIAFNTRHKYLLRTYTYFYDATDVYLVMEPCSQGMLYSELSRVKFFPPEQAAKYIAQLAEALMYLHRHHILHRDIKPENILLDHNNNIKLADFGWSVHDPNTRRKTSCGTPEYFPPELIARQVYDTTADLWCLGIFAFEMLVGKTPFAHAENDQVYANIKRGTFDMPTSVPEEAKDFINALLVKTGSERLALHRVVQHPFLVKYYYGPNKINPPTIKRPRTPANEILSNH